MTLVHIFWQVLHIFGLAHNLGFIANLEWLLWHVLLIAYLHEMEVMPSFLYLRMQIYCHRERTAPLANQWRDVSVNYRSAYISRTSNLRELACYFPAYLCILMLIGALFTSTYFINFYCFLELLRYCLQILLNSSGAFSTRIMHKVSSIRKLSVNRVVNRSYNRTSRLVH